VTDHRTPVESARRPLSSGNGNCDAYSCCSAHLEGEHLRPVGLHAHHAPTLLVRWSKGLLATRVIGELSVATVVVHEQSVSGVQSGETDEASSLSISRGSSREIGRGPGCAARLSRRECAVAMRASSIGEAK
jgi:hypothetical protein